MKQSAICLLEQAYLKRPDGEAVQDQEQTLTYAALRDSARRAAAQLLRETDNAAPVMVYLPKSAGMLQGMFASLYAGRAYVPTDSAAPAARLEKILRNLRPSAVITDEKLAANLAGLELHGTKVLLLGDLLQGAPDDAAVDRAVASVIDAEVKEIVMKAYRDCEQVLRDNIDRLHFVAGYLMKNEIMEEEQFVRAMTEPDVMMEQLEEMVAEKRRKSQEENEAFARHLEELEKQREEERAREEARHHRGGPASHYAPLQQEDEDSEGKD